MISPAPSGYDWEAHDRFFAITSTLFAVLSAVCVLALFLLVARFVFGDPTWTGAEDPVVRKRLVAEQTRKSAAYERTLATVSGITGAGGALAAIARRRRVRRGELALER